MHLVEGGASLSQGVFLARREQVVQLMEIDGRAVNGRYTTCCGASRVRASSAPWRAALSQTVLECSCR